MFRRLYRKFYKKFLFKKNIIELEEKTKFKLARFNYKEGLDKINQVLHKTHNRTFNLEKDSIHWLIWGSLATRRDINLRRILEIGTYKGEGTKILAELFPDAKIITIDLPETDPILKKSYKREKEGEYKNYLTEQIINTNYPNITLLKINSFFLTSSVSGQFDLIWVDGGHLFPEVVWDICNAWNLLTQNGVLMCDDVIPKDEYIANEYASSESYKVIKYLEERTSIKPIYFLKRLNSNYFRSDLMKKYVCYILKP